MICDMHALEKTDGTRRLADLIEYADLGPVEEVGVRPDDAGDVLFVRLRSDTEHRLQTLRRWDSLTTVINVVVWVRREQHGELRLNAQAVFPSGSRVVVSMPFYKTDGIQVWETLLRAARSRRRRPFTQWIMLLEDAEDRDRKKLSSDRL